LGRAGASVGPARRSTHLTPAFVRQPASRGRACAGTGARVGFARRNRPPPRTPGDTRQCRDFGAAPLKMQTLLDVILFAINLVWIILLVWVVLSWLVAFQVVNTRNQFVATIYRALQALTEPVLRPIRKILPNTGAIDLSPLVLVVILYILQRVIANNYIDLIS
jgi:YggT family protein